MYFAACRCCDMAARTGKARDGFVQANCRRRSAPPQFLGYDRPNAAGVREVLSGWADGFADRDGKFAAELQTTYNASFWDLYLFAVLKHLGIKVDFSFDAHLRSHQRRDVFICRDVRKDPRPWQARGASSCSWRYGYATTLNQSGLLPLRCGLQSIQKYTSIGLELNVLNFAVVGQITKIGLFVRTKGI
jgi:hypothetical protein